MASHGTTAIDLRLSVNDDDTMQRMLAAREATIGTKYNMQKQRENYPGSDHAPVKSTVSHEFLLLC